MSRGSESGLSTAKKAHAKRFFDGVVSGTIASGMLQPLDVVRTRMQSAPVRRSTWYTVRTIWKEDGVFGFWRGTTPSIVRVGMGVGLYFVVLEQLQDMLSSKDEEGRMKLSSSNAFLVGGASRAAVAALLCPFTVVKTRMEQTGPNKIKETNMIRLLRSISRTEGIPGLFRGLVPTIAANAPFSALYYLFYNRSKEWLEGAWEEGPLVNFVSGFCAAALATTITQPADILRTRIQLHKASPSVAGGHTDKRTARGMLSAMIQEEGLAVFTRGLVPRVAKRSLQTAVVWTIYEALSYTN